jgi:hypothetical protein
MNKVLSRRPSASMVVALIALVVASSGTAVAATKLVSGDGLIKKRSLSGNRLRNHTITGTQINFNRLGIVPSAADAANAGHASLANDATNATNSGELGGQPPSAYDSSSNFTRTGLVGADEGSSVTLGTFGPFTLTLTCVKVSNEPDSQVYVTSSQANSEAGGQTLSTAGIESSNPIVDSNPSDGFGESGAQVIDFATPNGVWMGILNAAVNYAGDVNQCVAWGVIDKS